ncbi:unnamed protein product [Tuber aestivum]|uniref:Swiss Army Knife protein DSP-PTPase phosphatase domain-containing protein n=1 Tax=Tuber aestivum TaxID=59557 RepID=A0A292PPY9_9PEZI|nr:unnamed protein product [Tuber aestivum]
MFPPGRGNDGLYVDRRFVISLFGTSLVLTAEGKDVLLREYEEGSENQIWVCKMNRYNRFGMRNVATARLLGRSGQNSRIGCYVTEHLDWASLTFTRLDEGGYSLMVMSVDQQYQFPIQFIDGGSPCLRIGGGRAQFGLHQLKNSVFRRFEWVIPNRLARSSAPYYDGEDSDESINETSIEFLAKHGIQNIISLNSVELSPRERGRLRAAKISYSYMQTQQCSAPTQEQFDQIWNAFEKGGVTIVYCGFGDGRTGTAISAIQIFQGRILSEMDYRANGVQCTSQIEALNALRERIDGVDNDSDSPDPQDNQPPPYTALKKDK